MSYRGSIFLAFRQVPAPHRRQSVPRPVSCDALRTGGFDAELPHRALPALFDPLDAAQTDDVSRHGEAAVRVHHPARLHAARGEQRTRWRQMTGRALGLSLILLPFYVVDFPWGTYALGGLLSLVAATGSSAQANLNGDSRGHSSYWKGGCAVIGRGRPVRVERLDGRLKFRARTEVA